MVTYFQMVADRSPLPVVLADYGLCRGRELGVEVVTALAGHPRIIGLIDADGRQERVAALKAGTRCGAARGDGDSGICRSDGTDAGGSRCRSRRFAVDG